MIWFPFGRRSKSFLGIDIGSSAIKVVELSGWREKKKLENYGHISTSLLQRKPFLSIKKDSLLLSARAISQAINAILTEAGIKTRWTVFSIPDFSTFYTTFELPPMSEEEITEAVEFEARRHVPLPLSEVTLDWVSIEGEGPPPGKGRKTKSKILLVAIPKAVIEQYQRIGQLSELKLSALEGEVFSLARALASESKKPVAIVDIGSRSTTISIVDQGILKVSHSFDVSGGQLTTVVAKSLNVGYNTAEGLKKEYGLLPNKERDVGKILSPLMDLILAEIDKVSHNFSQQEGKDVQSYIIAGGSALLPGLKDYFYDWLRKEVKIANPFSNIAYPPLLEETLEELGPSFAIAVGAALRGLE